MVGRIDVPYNSIIDRPQLNELYVILPPRYLIMKFATEKGIASIKGDQVEAKRGCPLDAKMVIKQPEVKTLETPKK